MVFKKCLVLIFIFSGCLFGFFIKVCGNNHPVEQVMVLSAGFGTRMRPITNMIPKPLVRVQNLTLIERIIDELIELKVKRIVINTHYKADLLENYISNKYRSYIGKTIIFSKEDILLDTGGGILFAINNKMLSKHKPIVIINSDIIYDNLKNNLLTLLNEYNNKKLKALLYLKHPFDFFGVDNKNAMYLFRGSNNKILRTNEFNRNKYCYVGISILDPYLFEIYSSNLNKFSLSLLFQKLSDDDMLYGKIFPNNIYQIDEPKKIEMFEKLQRSEDDKL